MLGDIFVRILEMSGKGSLVILGVLLARLALKRAPKIFSYLLWGVVLLRLLCPFTLEAPVSILPRTDSIAQEYTLADQPISPAGAGIAVYRAVGDAMNGGLGVQHIPTTQTTPEGNTHYVTSSWWEVWVLAGQYLWVAGAAGMALYSLAALWRLKKRLRVSVPLEKNVYLADDISGPFVLGLISPRIYLPPGLSPREQAYILLHERHHIRRGDPVFKALAYLALILHWFNPLAWLAFHLASQDMEMSCDEAVIRKLEPGARGDYAATLLSFATGRRPILGAPLAFGEGDPKGRIKNLSRWKKPAVWVLVLGAAACLILGLTLLTDPTDKEPQDLYMLPVQEESSSEILTREEVQKYLDEIASGIEEGSREGLLYSRNLPEEGEEAQYGLYSAPQSHGSGFTVTLNVITVYDGELEKPLLAWVEDTPGQLEDYIVTPYTYIGMDDFGLTQAAGESQLTLGVGYSVSIPQGKVAKERLTAVGYTLHGDGYYTATAHIYNYPESLFVSPEKFAHTLTILRSPDEFPVREGQTLEMITPFQVYLSQDRQGRLTLLETRREGNQIAYIYGTDEHPEKIYVRPYVMQWQDSDQSGEIPAQEGAAEGDIFQVEEIILQESLNTAGPWEVVVKLYSSEEQYPTNLKLESKNGSKEGKKGVSAFSGSIPPQVNYYVFEGGQTREETQAMLEQATLSWQGLTKYIIRTTDGLVCKEGLPLEIAHPGISSFYREYADDFPPVYLGETEEGHTIIVQGDYSDYSDDSDNLVSVSQPYLSSDPEGTKPLELLNEIRRGTIATYYYGVEEVPQQLYIRPQVISAVEELKEIKEIPVKVGGQNEEPFRITEISQGSGWPNDPEEYVLQVKWELEEQELPVLPELKMGETYFPGAISYTMKNQGTQPENYYMEFKIPMEVWEKNNLEESVITYSKLLRFITVEDNVYTAQEDVEIILVQ